MPVAQAQLLLMLIHGAALVSRGQSDCERFTAGIDAALDALRAPTRVNRHSGSPLPQLSLEAPPHEEMQSSV